jgi:hypothetical protein
MQYKTLFNINIHHGYFLDNGQEKFLTSNNNGMSEEDKKEALRNYNVSKYLQVTPTKSTQVILKNHRLLIKGDNQGFRILVSTLEEPQNKFAPIIKLEDELTLTFQLKATDPYFYNYTQSTALTNDRMYLFTNKKPAGESNDFETVFQNNDGKIDVSFLLKEASTRTIVRAIAEEDEQTTSQFSIANEINVIETDDTLTNGEKTTLINTFLDTIIKKQKKQGVIGYIRLTVKGDDNTQDLLNFEDPNQYTLNEHPNFTISFLNKRTFWRFISLKDGAVLTTKNKKWTSKNGYLEIKNSDFNPAGLDPPDTDPDDYNFPNPTAEIIKKENNKYYSEVFI